MKDNFQERKYIIGSTIILIGIVFILRLFFIQVIETEYRVSATNNSMRYVTQYPGRGLIYDRSGRKLLVYNEAAYDLMVIPRQIKAFDTTLLCKTIQIDKASFIKELNKAKAYSYYKPSIVMQQISSRNYATLQEIIYKFPGFSVQSRPVRTYPSSMGAHVLGYVGEVDDKNLKEDDYYKSGDYIGKTGIEKTYEQQLRGKKGVKIYLVDVHNRIQGNYEKGKYDEPAEAGNDIICSIDYDLQAYGELLMRNKKGSIVAIEPQTGEILALVSSPSYEPNLLVGQSRTNNYRNLVRDSLNPLFNRASMAAYPPGSTFKLINALIGLEEGVITPQTSFVCQNGYHTGSFSLGCHHNAFFTLIPSIQLSCNAYYCNVFRKIIDNKAYKNAREGYIHWRKHVISFGLGTKLQTDLTNELQGLIPTPEYFDKKYGGTNRWTSLMLVSMSIGQGEVGATPLQMANIAATIANRGFFYTPHLVHSIEKNELTERFKKRNYTTIDPEHYSYIVEGMELVVLAGTATTAKIKDIAVCGKTGTAQNPHGKDHSIFIAFAPKDNPKIAISVYVENAGFGSTWAAPIASLLMEKYIKGEVSKEYPASYWEKKILEADLINNLTIPVVQ